MSKGSFDFGNLRLAEVNDIPIYLSNLEGFYPQQEMLDYEGLQGGPRSVIYNIGRKTVKGVIQIPMYVNKDGQIHDGCKEIIRCADNPSRFFNLKANRGMMMADRTADIYNDPTSSVKHKRVTLESCVVTNFILTIPDSGNVTASCNISGLPSETVENNYNISPPSEDMMVRQCSYADCLITVGETNSGVPLVFKDQIKEFSFSFENKIEELYLLGQKDYASALLIGKTNIGGEWTEAVKSQEWNNEYEEYTHGGYIFDEKIRIRIADIVAYIDDVLYEPQQQPLASGLLKKKMKFKVMFKYGWVDETHNLVFRNL